jgi:magnesium transporter
MKKEVLLRVMKGMQSVEQIKNLVPDLRLLPRVEIAEIFDEIDSAYVPILLDQFELAEQGAIYAELNPSLQRELVQTLSSKRLANLWAHVPPHVRVDVYQQLRPEEQHNLLAQLPDEIRKSILELAAYPEDTAGGVMSKDYVWLKPHKTCAEALEKVRKFAPTIRFVYYLYVIDEQERLIGVLSLKELLKAAPTQLVGEVMRSVNLEFARVSDDREAVAQTVQRRGLLALPVVDEQNRMCGVVTYEDVIDIIQAENTEDLERFMGIMSGPTTESYLDTPSLTHFRRRAIWVVSLAAVGIISGLIIHRFEHALEKMIILALYMPMVADTGGNAGSQAATVIVRALALGEIRVRDWFRVIFKELRISLLLSACLGILAFLKILFLSWETETPAEYSLLNIAAVISLALSLQVISSTIIGGLLPLLVKGLGGDPAVASTPAITTIVDITGLLIYFGIATAFFGL